MVGAGRLCVEGRAPLLAVLQQLLGPGCWLVAVAGGAGSGLPVGQKTQRALTPV